MKIKTISFNIVVPGSAAHQSLARRLLRMAKGKSVRVDRRAARHPTIELRAGSARAFLGGIALACRYGSP